MQQTPLRDGPTPKNVISVCIDGIKDELIEGRMYHCYTDTPLKFTNQLQLLSEMEDLYDRLNFPQASTRDRTLKPKKVQTGTGKEVEAVREEQDVKNQVGRKASFIVRVNSRQNATWQGSISWTEKGVTKHFRSALELLKLIDSALDDEESKDRPENQGF